MVPYWKAGSPKVIFKVKVKRDSAVFFVVRKYVRHQESITYFETSGFFVTGYG